MLRSYLNDLIEIIGDQCYTIKELTRELRKYKTMDKMYTIEKVKGRRIKRGKIEYYVKWKGYSQKRIIVGECK